MWCNNSSTAHLCQQEGFLGYEKNVEFSAEELPGASELQLVDDQSFADNNKVAEICKELEFFFLTILMIECSWSGRYATEKILS